jgi:iron complex outermembrane recepter protein
MERREGGIHMRVTRTGLYLSAAVLGLVCNAAPAAAQSAGGTQASGGGLEEVVVTATRREEKLSKVPESISAFTAEKMDSLGVKSFADLAKYTPGVTYDEDSKTISIRGINSDAGSGTTGIYIDDTPIQIRQLGFNSNDTLPGIFDLDRVEVLRGPQGTLFGAGSEGGTVRYITPQPSLTDYSVYARGEVAFTQDGAPSYESGVAVGGPIIDDVLGFRVSVWGRRDGGYIDRVDYQTDQVTEHNANSQDTYSVRGALLFQPTPQLSITPSIFFQNRDQHDADDYWVSLSNPSSGNFVTGTPEHMADHDHFYLPTLKIEYQFPGMELISNFSYYDRDENVNGYSGTLYNLSYFQQSVDAGLDPNGNLCPGGLCATYFPINPAPPGTPPPPPLLLPTGLNLPGYPNNYISVATIGNTQKNLTQEVRLQSTDPNARLTWIVGGFFSYNTQQSIEQINDPQLPALTEYLWGEDMLTAWGQNLLPNGDDYINATLGHDRQIAGFINATFAITDQLKIQSGVRVAETHFDFNNYADGPQNFGYSSGSGHKDESPVTPMVGLTYQITPDDMVYGTYSQGYRIGGANAPLPPSCGTVNNATTYNSDTVTNYEVGTKDKLLNNNLSIDASAFYLNWNNIQQNIYIPICGIQYTGNLGSAISKGFDLQADWLVMDSLELDMSLGYTNAIYTNNVPVGAGFGNYVVGKGDTLPGSPWTLSLGGEYTFSILTRDSFIRLDYEFSSHNPGLLPEMDASTSSYDQGLVQDPATSQVSMRAGTQLGNFNVSLFGNNLLNSHPQLDLNHQDQFTLLYEAETLRPRTIGLTVVYRY